jgi:histidinol phosphatase-like enzyme
MLFRAAMDWNIDLRRSWMIGDILHDVEAGNRAGCSTILLNQGNETEWKKGRFRVPGHTCDNWNEIARIICP